MSISPTSTRRVSKQPGTQPCVAQEYPYFRLYDLRSTYATRLSAGGVADDFVTKLLRQGDAKVFKKYSQMKLQMKREAQLQLNRNANESRTDSDTVRPNKRGFDAVLTQ